MPEKASKNCDFPSSSEHPNCRCYTAGCFRSRSGATKTVRVRLPQGGWCETEQLETGQWQWLQPERVTIPANFGRQSGRWYLIDSGVQGVLVQDERGGLHVYVLTEPASHYYHIMSRHDQMPLLVDQRI